MLIDWFTVAAQVVNFVVLVAILRYFLYGRVVRVMTERQERIQRAFTEAEEREAEAAREAERLAAERRELETARERQLRELREEVEARRQEMLEEARAEVARLRDEWQRGLAAERDRLTAEVRAQVGEAVTEVTRAALTDLAGADLEERMVHVFLQRLDHLDGEERAEMAELLSGARVTVVSAHPLGSDHREALERALADELGVEGPLGVERDPELGCGLELRAGGRSVGWSLDRYLDRVSERFEDLVAGEDEDAG